MKRHLLPLLLLSLVLFALIATSLSTNVPKAHAAVYSYYYAVVTGSCGACYEKEISTFSVGPGTGANITRSWTDSNSWGANVGITDKLVSATVNFNVTESYSISWGCNTNVNETSHTQYLQWWDYFNETYYDVYLHTPNGTQYAGSGWADQYTYSGCNFIP